MSASEIEGMDSPKNYKKRESPMNKWLNVIFKMMLDGYGNETIYFYIREREDFAESAKQLEKYIYLIGKNNFPERIPFHACYLMENVIPSDVICFKRTEMLKYLLTCNPKVQKDNELGKYIDLIKEEFPLVSHVESVFKEFHAILMGNDPEKMDKFLEKYTDGELAAFCNGIKRDIALVKNAVSQKEATTNSNSSNRWIQPTSFAVKRLASHFFDASLFKHFNTQSSERTPAGTALFFMEIGKKRFCFVNDFVQNFQPVP